MVFGGCFGGGRRQEKLVEKFNENEDSEPIEQQHPTIEQTNKITTSMKPHVSQSSTESKKNEDYAKTVLKNKVEYLLHRLETEEDLGKIRDILDLIQICKQIESIHF